MTEAKEPSTCQSAMDTINEAEQVRDELCAALHGAGITLPSLGIDPVAYTEDKPRPLVELGRCNIQTARKLTAALVNVRQP